MREMERRVGWMLSTLTVDRVYIVTPTSLLMRETESRVDIHQS